MTAPWIAALVVLWILVLSLAIVCLGLLRRIAPVLERAETSLAGFPIELQPGGLEAGSSLPTFSARTLDGVAFTDEEMRGHESIAIFFESGCPACRALEAELRAADVAALGLPIYVVVRESEETAAFAALKVDVIVDEDNSVKRAFRSNVAPHAFAISADGVVTASGTPNTFDGLRLLAHELRQGGEHRAEPRIAVSI